MIHAVLCVALLTLAGCAGIATYNVRPFYDATSKQVICCEAAITNGKDIAGVTVHVTKSGDDYTIDFAETGVIATAPLTAAGATASAIAGAISNTAVSAAKILH